MKKDKRLSRPRYASQQSYELMLDCWKWNSLSRPKFDQIVERIERILENGEQLDIETDLSSDIYYIDHFEERYYTFSEDNYLK